MRGFRRRRHGRARWPRRLVRRGVDGRRAWYLHARVRKGDRSGAPPGRLARETPQCLGRLCVDAVVDARCPCVKHVGAPWMPFCLVGKQALCAAQVAGRARIRSDGAPRALVREHAVARRRLGAYGAAAHARRSRSPGV
eukprot:4734853-Pleurochrysis_carterae.AAC.1